MDPKIGDKETLLEIGLIAAVLLLLGGAALLLVGRASGGVAHRARHHEAPPSPGEVPASSHSNTQTSSAR